MTDHPIVDFMRERITEFETTAHLAKVQREKVLPSDMIRVLDRARPLYSLPDFVLENMIHMRAMVDYLALKMAPASGEIDARVAGHVLLAEVEALAFLRHMAAPFVDHPDYRKEWAT